MSKRTKKKYYAIKEGKGVNNLIANTWEECSKLVLGYNSVYKAFPTREEAEKYLENVDVNKVKEQTKRGIEAKKISKATTKTLNIRIPKDIYEDFEKKCIDMELPIDKVIETMIKEWLF